MRRLLAITGLAAALFVGPSVSTADAASALGLPLDPVYAAGTVPPWFTSDAQQAVTAAEHTATLRALHRREHPLDVQAYVFARHRWYIDFSYRGTLVAEVDVAPNGRVEAVWTGPLAALVDARGHFPSLFGSPWVLVPFSLLFLVPFVDLRRRRVQADALLILALLVSYELFTHTRLEAAAWLIYPPLIVLAGRMLLAGVRGSATRLPELLETRSAERILWAGLLSLVIARVVLSLASHTVVDTGYASVIGAHRLTHGQVLYDAVAGGGPTYGPIMYLAYAPFELALPWHGTWNALPSAHAATVVFDLVTVLGLVALGRRLAPGATGRRTGLLLAWAWAACPLTLFGVMMHASDGLIAMLAVLSLLVFRSPAARGALLGLGAGAMAVAGALLPLYAVAHERSRRCATACLGAFAVALGAALLLLIPGGGLGRIYEDTIADQPHGADGFSAWLLHPGLGVVRTALVMLALVLALGVAVLPGRRSLPAICALAGAVTIVLQLPSTHWFYYAVVWFLPYVFVAVLAPSAREPVPPPGSATQPAGREPRDAPELAPV